MFLRALSTRSGQPGAFIPFPAASMIFLAFHGTGRLRGHCGKDKASLAGELNVEVSHLKGVQLNEITPRLDQVAHQRREDRFGRICL